MGVLIPTTKKSLGEGIVSIEEQGARGEKNTLKRRLLVVKLTGRSPLSEVIGDFRVGPKEKEKEADPKENLVSRDSKTQSTERGTQSVKKLGELITSSSQRQM